MDDNSKNLEKATDQANPPPSPKIEKIEKPEQKQLQALVHHQHHSGPLPPAAELKRYEEALPGIAERIVSMAEAQQKHRHKMEEKDLSINEIHVKAYRNETYIGQFLAFLIVMSVICASIYLMAFTEAKGTGALLSGATITALATVFIKGRSGSKKDNGEKKG